MARLSVVFLPLVALCCAEAFLFSSDDECDGEEYNRNFYVCCGDKLIQKETHMVCCEGEMIDDRNHTCHFGTKGTLYRKYCNGEPYDYMIQFCCDKKLFSYRQGKRCCRGSLYDPKDYNCGYLSGQLMKKQ
ncbi:hypothetical protein LSAT2_026155 [Lamellibrachia satsuma]|nr:hypothetical protein LSAT2_026155 [Lamellibrachia satsuma]